MIHNSNVQSVETPGYRRARQDYEKQKGPDMLKSIFPTVGGGSGGSGGGAGPDETNTKIIRLHLLYLVCLVLYKTT